MKVWVIMSNDYPMGVCSTKEKAEKKIEALKADQDRRYGRGAVIFWRAYDFDVDSD